MTSEYFQATLEAMLLRRPFRPSTIELHGGTRFDIDTPLATTLRDGKAIFLSPGSVPIWFDNESVLNIINSPAHAAPGKEGNPNGK